MTPKQIKAASEALSSLDDYARMNTGVDAIGPRGVLERFISEAERTTAPVSLTDEKIIQRFESHIDTGPDCFDLQDGDSAYWIKQSEMVKFARALLAAAPAPIQQVPTAWCTDAHFEAWCERHDMRKDRSDHRQMFDDAASLYLTVPATPSTQPELSGSIDGPEFREKLQAHLLQYQRTMGLQGDKRAEFIAHIDAWKDAACAAAVENVQAEVVTWKRYAEGVEMRATDAEAKLAAIRDGLDKLTTYNPGIQWGVKNWQGGLVLISKNEVRAMLAQRTASPSQSDTNGLPG